MAVGMRWASGNADVDFDEFVEVGLDAVGAGEDAAVDRAVTAGDHDSGLGCRLERLLQRPGHVLRHDAGDEQPVGVAR